MRSTNEGDRKNAQSTFDKVGNIHGGYKNRFVNVQLILSTKKMTSS
jgi:hypothetical protein